jgi:hypothetical protein
MTIVWKLSQSQVIRPSCVAEELAAHILIQEAESLLELRGVPSEFDDFYDAFFKDLDFEYLYDDIEKADIAETIGITYLAFAEWFERFGPPDSLSYPEVHPYAQAEYGNDNEGALSSNLIEPNTNDDDQE